MFIDGFAISMYRSFGPEVQLIGPLGKINVIVGQNNSGKLNILLFLKDHFRNSIQDIVTAQVPQGQNRFALAPIERHIGRTGPSIKGIALKL